MTYRRFSPQQKKQMRLMKDRRNAYGENDKASRKAICLKKRIINKTYRKNTKQKLLLTNDKFIEEYAELIDINIKNVKRKYWKKYPDICLKEHIEKQSLSRIKRINRKNN